MNEDSDHQIDLRQVADELPAGFNSLLDASLKEGVRNLARLDEHWRSGLERFDQHGAALFAAFHQETLIGIAGVSREQSYSSPAMRMRRLFVEPKWRRKGVARLLAQRCMSTGLVSAETLTCNARATAAAGPFWVSMGFRPVALPDITHVYDRI
jgi:GNAT superfamily N-acetyltransferase